MDSKRPFGNSSIFEDMCEILDLELVEVLGEGEMVPARHKDTLEEHARKLPDVFRIVLRHGRRTGEYVETDDGFVPVEEMDEESEL
ncbi:hypothetical protein G3I44_14220 [Halogeometricum borinquense]|uniref:Uncharacterized protein n=1 Tax=Halogeometricum borinquense TaxID=60847 RepID=A0A6C0ULU7_9EURY|nr:hypothetical protein [Halogeometricum borinquense]QIB75341.1 hypothetical protein G3I44_14220 [Halogeometricum borinquense]